MLTGQIEFTILHIEDVLAFNFSFDGKFVIVGSENYVKIYKPILPNRLTYPEIYNKESNDHLFYTDTENLIDKVESLIKKNVFNSKDIPKNLIQKFDWSNMIDEYDGLLDTILK